MNYEEFIGYSLFNFHGKNMDRFKRIAPESAPRITRFGEIPKYDEGLYDLGNDVYAWMVPNGSWGESNAGLVLGKGSSLLIDTLWDVKYTRAMLEAMDRLLLGNPIGTVVNTHADGDHWWGNELVSEAEIITSRAAYEEMSHIKPVSMILMCSVLGKLLQHIGAGRVGHWFSAMGAPYGFGEVTPALPTRTFGKELTLDAGGREIRLFMVGPAHTEGDVIVHVPDAGIVFCADIVFMDSTPVMWAGPIKNMFAALNKILDMDADIIVPGHGPITDKQGVRMVMEYWQYVETRANERYDAGMSAAEAAEDILLSGDFAVLPFSRWNAPERMMTNVNTIYRHRNGKTGRLGVPALLSLLAKQARLAHLLPDARPAVMRKR